MINPDLIGLIADDKQLVTYRPSLRAITGSVTGTILLQQIIYWATKSNGKFYKFSSPCKHPKYVAGDSWEEELGLSAKEIRTALSHFAFKCGKKNRDKYGSSYELMKENKPVVYYVDANRVTWYMLNRHLLYKLLLGIYKESDQQAVTNLTETNAENSEDSLKWCNGDVESKAVGSDIGGDKVKLDRATVEHLDGLRGVPYGVDTEGERVNLPAHGKNCPF